MQRTRSSSSAFALSSTLGSENVKAVWFLESDMIFGDSAGSAAPGAAARNSGGALGGDKVQTETKNIYVWFKVPDTSVDFTVGLQSQSDDYAGIIYGGADMAGVFMTGKFEPVTYKLGWAKLYENATNRSDDMTLYVAEAKFVAAKDVRIGGNFYFLQHDANKVAGTLPGSRRFPAESSAAPRCTCPASARRSRPARPPSAGSPSTSSGRSNR